jgi:hypothetical protein
MLDGEARIEGRPDHADALLEALNSLALLREWIVLDVVRPGDLIQELELALVGNFLVESPNRLLVVILVFSHVMSPSIFCIPRRRVRPSRNRTDDVPWPPAAP